LGYERAERVDALNLECRGARYAVTLQQKFNAKTERNKDAKTGERNFHLWQE